MSAHQIVYKVKQTGKWMSWPSRCIIRTDLQHTFIKLVHSVKHVWHKCDFRKGKKPHCLENNLFWALDHLSWLREVSYYSVKGNLHLPLWDVTLSRSWKWQNEIPFEKKKKENLHIWHVDSWEEKIQKFILSKDLVTGRWTVYGMISQSVGYVILSLIGSMLLRDADIESSDCPGKVVDSPLMTETFHCTLPFAYRHLILKASRQIGKQWDEMWCDD